MVIILVGPQGLRTIGPVGGRGAACMVRWRAQFGRLEGGEKPNGSVASKI